MSSSESGDSDLIEALGKLEAAGVVQSGEQTLVTYELDLKPSNNASATLSYCEDSGWWQVEASVGPYSAKLLLQFLRQLPPEPSEDRDGVPWFVWENANVGDSWPRFWVAKGVPGGDEFECDVGPFFTRAEADLALREKTERS